MKRHASKVYPLLFFQLMFFCQIMSAQHPKWLDTTRVTLKVVDKSLAEIGAILEIQCSRTINKSRDGSNRYKFDIKQKLMIDVLKDFSGKGIHWSTAGDMLTLWDTDQKPPDKDKPPVPGKLIIKDAVLRGSVVDDRGEPLLGATVTVKGTHQGTLTDHSGHFELKVQDSVIALIVTFIGFKTTEWCGSVRGSVKIILEPGGSSLNEVSIPGYLPMSKSVSTGAVSTVSGADFERYATTNIATVLQGRVTGFAVTPSNGLSGASYKMETRGKNSLFNGRDPLILIDGTPLAANNENLNGLTSILTQNTGGGASPLATINPAYIDTVFLLKDAATTAIYGSRAANGVVSIKMKKGARDGLSVIFDTDVGFRKPTRIIKMLNTRQYIALRKEGFINDNIVPNDIPGTIGFAPDIADTTSQTSWQHVLLGNTAMMASANLFLSIGTEKTQVFSGFGYRKETTPFSSNTGYAQASGYSSLRYESTNSRFVFLGTMYFSTDDNKLYDGSLWSLFLRPNVRSLYAGNNSLYWGENGEYFPNPEADRRKTYKINTDNLIFSSTQRYAFSDRMSLKMNLGYSGTFVRENLLLPIAAQNPALSDVILGSSTFATNRFDSYIAEPMVECSLKHLNIIVGSSFQYSKNQSLRFVGRGYRSDAFLTRIDSAAYYSDTLPGGSQYKYGAFFGQAHYNYKDKYIASVTYRIDGSSRFSPEKRFGHFGAIGAGWIFSREPFMEPLKSILEYAKLRTSYGVTGNDQIGDYKYLDTWAPTRGQPFQGMAGFKPESLYNPEYSWERSRKFDIATDLQFVKGMWSLNVNYFLNRSDKQLVQVTLPAQTGSNSVLKNFNAMIENKGWELAIDGVLYRRGSMRISTVLALTMLKNRLVRFEHLDNTQYASTLLIDRPISALNVFKFEGVDPKTGVDRLKDVDNNGDLNDNDRMYMGHLDPPFYGSASVLFSYGKFELNIFNEFKIQTVPSYTYSAILGDLLMGLPFNQPIFADDHWRQEGDNSQYAKASTSRTSDAHAKRSFVAASSKAYTNGSYFKIGNLYLGYTCTSKRLSAAGIQSLKFSLKVENLATFTTYDAGSPEIANPFALSPLRTIAVGIRATFKDFKKKDK